MNNCCYICGSNYVEMHHIFGGRHNRKITDKYPELLIPLCPEHHRGTRGVHGSNGKDLSDKLKQIGQEIFESRMILEGMSEQEAREYFMKEFGRNYL